MVGLYMRSEINPRVDPHQRESHEDETQGQNEGKYDLIRMDMGKDEIDPEERWRDRKAHQSQTGKEENERLAGILINMTLMLLQIDAGFQSFQLAQTCIPDKT